MTICTSSLKASFAATCVFAAFVLSSQPSFAANKIGDACAKNGGINTVASVVPTEGVIQCIPDSNGNYFWQPMGAGVARYDATTSCNVAGGLRWNGSSVQYCDGTNWQSMGGSAPSGAICGLSTTGGGTMGAQSMPCQGKDPYVSCPAGWTQRTIGLGYNWDMGTYLYHLNFCQKN